MTKLDTVRWGIVGCGDVCEVKSGPALYKTEHSKLVAVMRRNQDKAKDFAARHGVPKWYGDAVDIINDHEINAIYIATPPHMHAAYTRMAAAAGKPVYVEKPMARTYEECREMIRVCEEADVPLFVAYYRRCLPNFLKIKQLIEEGAIGEVRLVNIEMYRFVAQDFIENLEDNWRVKPEIAGGGIFYDLASHQLDYLDYIFGPVTKVEGIAANQAGLYEAEDIVSASFEFSNGVVGTGIWCFTTAELAAKERTYIIGSKGVIHFRYFGNPEVILENERGKQTFKLDYPQHIQQPLIQKIVEELRGIGTSPSTGVSGARTNRVMEQIVRNR